MWRSNQLSYRTPVTSEGLPLPSLIASLISITETAEVAEANVNNYVASRMNEEGPMLEHITILQLMSRPLQKGGVH